MTFVIVQPCVDTMDRSCVDVCPVDCIHFEEGVDRMLYIEPVECIDCGACVPACPVTAIFIEAELPDDQKHFAEINALWYRDRDAARARLADIPVAASAEAAQTDVEPQEGAAPSQAAAAAAEPSAEEPAATAEAPPQETVEETVEPEPEPEPVTTQVALAASAEPEGLIIPHYALPSPLGLVALAGFAALFFVMWVLPGPRWLVVAGVGLHVGVLLAGGPAVVLLLLFLRSQAQQMARFAARHERPDVPWRERRATWRRSEESRSQDLLEVVQKIAEERFSFPNERFPDLQTHVNLPEPSMALEFGGGGGEKAFPDILVVEYPGNYPVMVAQVETAETLTREQVERVWTTLESAEAPLTVYVPAGLAARARDYARAAGIAHVRFRTWRRQPHGMVVREL